MNPAHLLVAGLALALPAGAALAEDAGEADATRRLRACVTSGIDVARDSLAATVVAIRALCGHQINDLRRARYRRIGAEQTTPDAAGSAAIDRLKADEDRRLNSEIAHMVARLTGLDG